MLDVVGKGRHADAAIAVGVLSAVPTALVRRSGLERHG